MSDNLEIDGFEKVQDLEQQTVRQHGEIRQLEEKVETLTQQKHSLEQINIGYERELKRYETDLDASKRSISRLIAELSVESLKRIMVEEELTGIRLSIQQFMEKYEK